MDGQQRQQRLHWPLPRTQLQQRTRWPPTRRQVLWTVGIVVALVVLIRIGYAYQWTGFGQSKANEVIQPAKTLWDWLDLLIVPAVLAIGGFLLSLSANRATQAAAERRAQDEALQAYLDQMSAMLTPNKDLPSLYKARPGDSLSEVARARTLTVLPRLFGDRKARVVQFLHEAGLIAKDRPIVDLSGANLIEADLDEVDLKQVDLRWANLSFAQLNLADLSRADLSGANLSRADLSEANLREANLNNADLREADLNNADLREVSLNGAGLGGANLSQVDLSKASMHGATLSNAKLSFAHLNDAELLEGASMGGADLRNADLRGVKLSGLYLEKANLDNIQGFTNEELEKQAGVLRGTTMPSGQKYEDWRESMVRGVGLGEQVTVGDVSYRVINAKRVQQLHDPDAAATVSNGKFIVVTFSFTNNGDNPVPVRPDVWPTLNDSKGRWFKPDTDAAQYLPQDENFLLLDRVDPGFDEIVRTVYSVPPGAKGFKLIVTSGGLAAETARVKLYF